MVSSFPFLLSSTSALLLVLLLVTTFLQCLATPVTQLLPLNQPPALHSHAQVTIRGRYNNEGSVDKEYIAVFGGYTFDESVIHRDINDHADGLIRAKIRMSPSLLLFDVAAKQWYQVIAAVSATFQGATGSENNSILWPAPRMLHTISSTAAGDGLYLFGGTNCFNQFGGNTEILQAPSLNDLWLFSLSTGTWSELGPHQQLPECSGTAILLPALLSLILSACLVLL